MGDSLAWVLYSTIPSIRTFVFHMLETYVTILCNWLILWQNAFYLYLGRSRIYFILQEIRFQVQVLKSCMSIQDSSVKSVVHQSSTASIYQALKICSRPWLDSSSADRHLLRFMKLRFSSLFFIQSVIICLGLLFSQP